MKILSGIVIMLVSISVSGQLKGKVTYRITMEKDSLEQPYANPENTDIENDVWEMMHQAQPVEGYLVFNDSVAIYKVEPKIDIPGWNNTNDGLIITPSRINLIWFMAGGNSTYYTDFSRNYSITQNAIMGPTVRILSKPIEWTLTEETVKIDGYTCYLATKDKLQNKKLRVWYTPDIAVKHGPKGFNGLPGLVLKIEDVTSTWTVTKIDFDTIEANDIIEPIEGDLLTPEAFRKFTGDPFSDN